MSASASPPASKLDRGRYFQRLYLSPKLFKTETTEFFLKINAKSQLGDLLRSAPPINL